VPDAVGGMRGDDRARHCDACGLTVHDLSAMSRDEAAAVVGGEEGRVCVAFHRRADGRILTQDCPRGVAALRARARRLAGRVAALAGALFAAIVFMARGRDSCGTNPGLGYLQPFAMLIERYRAKPPLVTPPSPPAERMLGKIIRGRGDGA
jgi:hypothetical protein